MYVIPKFLANLFILFLPKSRRTIIQNCLRTIILGFGWVDLEWHFYYKLFLWFNWLVFHIIHFFLVASCNFDHSNSHFSTFPYNLHCQNCPVDQLSNADSHFWPMTYSNHSIQNYPRHLYLFHPAKWFSICSEIGLKQAWKCSSYQAWANSFGSRPVRPWLHLSSHCYSNHSIQNYPHCFENVQATKRELIHSAPPPVRPRLHFIPTLALSPSIIQHTWIFWLDNTLAPGTHFISKHNLAPSILSPMNILARQYFGPRHTSAWVWQWLENLLRKNLQ